MSTCTWCKIGLSAALALIGLFILKITVATGGTGNVAVPLIASWIIKNIAIFSAASIGFVQALAAFLWAAFSAGLGFSFLGDWICCNFLGVKNCCPPKPIAAFLKAFQKQLAEEPEDVWSEEDCERLSDMLEKALKEKSITEQQAEKYRALLEEYCE